MTDAALVQKKLDGIEAQVRRLLESARLGRLETDVREQYFIQHSLQIAIQSALDVALHIVAERRLGEPASSARISVPRFVRWPASRSDRIRHQDS